QDIQWAVRRNVVVRWRRNGQHPGECGVVKGCSCCESSGNAVKETVLCGHVTRECDRGLEPEKSISGPDNSPRRNTKSETYARRKGTCFPVLEVIAARTHGSQGVGEGIKDLRAAGVPRRERTISFITKAQVHGHAAPEIERISHPAGEPCLPRS